MATMVEKARLKIDALRKEIADLEAFLRVHDALEHEIGGLGYRVTAYHETNVPLNDQGNEMPSLASQKSIDSDLAVKKRWKPTRRPDEIASHMERIVREVGRPMTRGEIVQAFEQRDIQIPYEDKARYLGTIAWRNKGIFENIEGKGYWIRGEPIPRRNILGDLKPRERLTPVDDSDDGRFGNSFSPPSDDDGFF